MQLSWNVSQLVRRRTVRHRLGSLPVSRRLARAATGVWFHVVKWNSKSAPVDSRCIAVAKTNCLAPRCRTCVACCATAAAAAAARKTAFSVANARLPIAIASASTLPTAAVSVAPAATSSAVLHCKPAAIAARSAARTVAAATFALAARRFAAAPAKQCDRKNRGEEWSTNLPRVNQSPGATAPGLFYCAALDDDCVIAISEHIVA